VAPNHWNVRRNDGLLYCFVSAAMVSGGGEILNNLRVLTNLPLILPVRTGPMKSFTFRSK
jgi:hypothetical protein